MSISLIGNDDENILVVGVEENELTAKFIFSDNETKVGIVVDS